MAMRAKRSWTMLLVAGQCVALLSVPVEHKPTGMGSSPEACSLRIAWQANSEPDVAGYRLHYGPSSHHYLWTLDVGNTTSALVDDLARGMRYYFAVTAYDSTGNESLFSSEVSGVAGVDVSTVIDLQPEEYVVAALREGDQYYVDRTYQIVEIPEAFEGLLWIKTKNDSKFDPQLQVRFSLLRRVRLFVAHDSRVSTPAWLSGDFTLTAAAIRVSDAGNTDFRLWESKRQYQPGETVILGCNGAASAGSMYVVLLRVESAAADLQPQIARSGADLVLSWDALPDAQYYRVYRGEHPYFCPESACAVVGETEFVDEGAATGAGRYYVLEAVRGAGQEPLRRRIGTFGVRLEVGRNLVSVPLQSREGHIRSLLGQTLTGGANALVADRVMKWHGAGYEIAWLVSGTGTPYDGEWMNEAGSAVSTMTLTRGEGFWAEVRKGHQPATLQFFGEVPTDSAHAIVVRPGLNLIGSCYPVSVPLTATGLWEQGVAKGATNSREADRIMAWRGDHYEVAWLVDGTGTNYDGKWLNATGSDTSQLRLEPGKGYWLHIRSGGQPRTWNFPNPFPGR
ncbi:MAG: fibronectin type III domain-containing protein [bacterium]|nr:fibronectin type III domain-containing protein [candidate division KSB1 bacterium]MDH7558852.1 fibronectin type III domain-containing protein [bacterium]